MIDMVMDYGEYAEETTEETTVPEAAARARTYFARSERASGESYWHATENAPGWVKELCCAAHGGMFPDDFRYRFLVEALDALAEAEADEVDEISLEPDYRTHVQLAWLCSYTVRPEYCDEATREWCVSSTTGILDQVCNGYAWEQREVLDLVRSWLTEHADKIGEE